MGHSSSVPEQAHSVEVGMCKTLKKYNLFMTCVESAGTEGAHPRILFDAPPWSSITGIRQQDLVLGALKKTTINISLVWEVVAVKSLKTGGIGL